VMAAALAPAAPVPASGAGPVSSRVGTGAPVANAANALAATVVAGLIEGGQQRLDTATDDPHAKACTLAVWQQLAPGRSELASPPRTAAPPLPRHAARAGPTRAPPTA